MVSIRHIPITTYFLVYYWDKPRSYLDILEVDSSDASDSSVNSEGELGDEILLQLSGSLPTTALRGVDRLNGMMQNSQMLLQIGSLLVKSGKCSQWK